MTAKIVKFPEPPTANECLDNCKDRLESVTIIGYDENGSLIINGNMEIPETYFILMMAAKVFLDECMGADHAVH